jgi:hypothetical protein
MAYLATPIDSVTANNYLQTNATIKDKARTYVVNAVMAHATQLNTYQAGLADKAQNFFNDGYNVYVFSKDDFERFFTGDPNDPHSNLQFTHCMVIVGSLPADEIESGVVIKQKGEQTIMIAGCTEDTSNPGNYVTNVNGVSLQKPGAQHPPRNYIPSF